MAKDALDTIRDAEARALQIREKAKADAAGMISKTKEEAGEALAGAVKAAAEYKERTLAEISDKAGKLIEKNADEAKYDASKVTNHADRMSQKAVDYIIGSLSGDN